MYFETKVLIIVFKISISVYFICLLWFLICNNAKKGIFHIRNIPFFIQNVQKAYSAGFITTSSTFP